MCHWIAMATRRLSFVVVVPLVIGLTLCRDALTRAAPAPDRVRGVSRTRSTLPLALSCYAKLLSLCILCSASTPPNYISRLISLSSEIIAFLNEHDETHARARARAATVLTPCIVAFKTFLL